MTLGVEQPHRVDVALGHLVTGRYDVAQVHASGGVERLAQQAQHLVAVAFEADAHPVARIAALPRRLDEFGECTVHGVAFGEAGNIEQRAQTDGESECLVAREAQRFGDRVGVAHVDVALLPFGLDEVVGHVARCAAHEEEGEVGLDLLAAHAEGACRLLDVDALTAHEPRHHGQQARETGGRGLAGDRHGGGGLAHTRSSW